MTNIINVNIDTKVLLARGLDQLSIEHNDEIINKFIVFMKNVLVHNKDINLTAIKDEKEFIVKHFLDSVVCSNWDMVRSAKRVIDIGTGIGMPGVPLAILLPDKEFVLVDSLRKRLTILNEIIKVIKLHNVKIIHERAEDLARNIFFREAFDLSISRAVADLKILVELCIPFLSVGGFFLAYKGGKPNEEIHEAKKAIMTLGGRIEEICEVGNDNNRSIVIIKKVSHTPDCYPRKAGMPKKKPIC